MKVCEQLVYPHASYRILLQVVLIISPKHVLQHLGCTGVATNLAVTCTVRGVSVVGSNPGTTLVLVSMAIYPRVLVFSLDP